MRWLIIVLLMACAAFFAASETAVSYSNRIRMRTLADEGDKRAARLCRVTDSFDRALVTLLICINIAYVTASSVATVAAIDLFGSLPVVGKYASVAATVVLTLAVFVFCETIPKNFARANADEFAMTVSGVILVLMRLFTPVSFVFSKLGEAVKRLFDRGGRTPTMTEDEFSEIIESISGEGVFEPEESDIILGAIEFSDLSAADVMTARADVDFIDIGETQERIRELILDARHSRIPVCDGGIDSVVGIVQTSDCLWQLMNSDGKSLFLRAVMKRPYIIAPDMNAQTLFEEMERRRTHIAVVAKDGETLGIVTMEDILEQLVGEIYDEEEKPDGAQNTAVR